ncbi:MAG: helix-turn-helix transcriptional regulator [Pseudolabrys sp.]|nr:helix-turn-helix transcriptional regulator [Pseudolabrys sp.]
MANGEISGAQVRAARAFLNWTLKDLAERSGAAVSAIHRIEAGDDAPAAKDTGVPQTYEFRAARIAESLAKVVKTLEAAGVAFLPDQGRGAGVRYKQAARRR